MKVITNQNILTTNLQIIMPNITQGSFEREAISLKSLGRPKKVTGNVNSSKSSNFKIYSSKFSWGEIVNHTDQSQKLVSEKVLQMITGDTIEFENDIPTKHNAKVSQFFSRERDRYLNYLGRNVT